MNTYLGVLVERAVCSCFELDCVEAEGIEDAVGVVQVACLGKDGNRY